MNRSQKLLIVLAIGLLMWVIPAPDGVTSQAWQLVAIMTATIVGFMINPLPIGAMAFLGMIALILTNTLSPGKARLRLCRGK